mmetsp:Transcript_2391/g.4123  ORF Transcript_2391/g.4123 Transcript_2391/m.4123 type:complete len:169 (+) Transcript_2391:1-507(+)
MAVQQSGSALICASECCRSDRGVVWAAVQQNWRALQYAGESVLSDRELILLAADEHPSALDFASDEMIQDHTFGAEVKATVCIIKVTMMSGRSCHRVLRDEDLDGEDTESIIEAICDRLQLIFTGSERLVYGSQIVPADTTVRSWPGNPRVACIAEYQLIVMKHRRQT